MVRPARLGGVMSRRCDCYLPERVRPRRRRLRRRCRRTRPTARVSPQPRSIPDIPSPRTHHCRSPPRSRTRLPHEGGGGSGVNAPGPITTPAPNPVPAAAARRRRRRPTVRVSPRLIIRRPDTSLRANAESLIDAGSEDVRGGSGEGRGRCSRPALPRPPPRPRPRPRRSPPAAAPVPIRKPNPDIAPPCA